MENEIELRKVLDTPDELKDAANIYYKCINLHGIKLLKSPSLKFVCIICIYLKLLLKEEND